MFTGIITDVGTVAAVEMRGDMRARVACNYDMGGVDMGASIACDGICLTVVAKGPDWFEVSLIPTTLRDTIHGALPVGGEVNLEVDVLAKYVEKMLHPEA